MNRTLTRAKLKAKHRLQDWDYRQSSYHAYSYKTYLRPDFEVELILPKDLTIAEAARLGRIILTFPFEEKLGRLFVMKKKKIRNYTVIALIKRWGSGHKIQNVKRIKRDAWKKEYLGMPRDTFRINRGKDHIATVKYKDGIFTLHECQDGLTEAMIRGIFVIAKKCRESDNVRKD